MSSTGLFDQRGEFFNEWFERSLPFEQYVETGSHSQRQRWQGYSELLGLSPIQRELIGRWSRQMNVLVLSGIWCGDCMRQGPMLNIIARAAPDFNLRFAENSACPPLVNELRIHGGSRVPVVVTLSEDFYELSRFGDKHLSVYRRKAAEEAVGACETGFIPPEGEALKEELAEWITHFQRLQLMLQLSPLLKARYGEGG